MIEEFEFNVEIKQDVRKRPLLLDAEVCKHVCIPEEGAGGAARSERPIWMLDATSLRRRGLRSFRRT